MDRITLEKVITFDSYIDSLEALDITDNLSYETKNDSIQAKGSLLVNGRIKLITQEQDFFDNVDVDIFAPLIDKIIVNDFKVVVEDYSYLINQNQLQINIYLSFKGIENSDLQEPDIANTLNKINEIDVREETNEVKEEQVIVEEVKEDTRDEIINEEVTEKTVEENNEEVTEKTVEENNEEREEETVQSEKIEESIEQDISNEEREENTEEDKSNENDKDNESICKKREQIKLLKEKGRPINYKKKDSVDLVSDNWANELFKLTDSRSSFYYK